MTRAIVRLVLACVATAVVACGASAITGAGASANGQITWRVQDQRVDVTNASAQSVRYVVLGRAWMHNALVDWCFGMPQCGATLATNATVKRAYSEIEGGDPPEREAIIVWWTPSGTGSVPFDTAIVRIR